MPVPAVPVAIAAVVALIAFMGGGKASDSKTTDVKPTPTKPYDLGVFDGANDCANGVKTGAKAAAAIASGDAVQYNLGYALGYGKGCPAPGPSGPTTPTFKCMSTSADAGITLAQAQTALAKLGYAFDDAIGTCGASTIAAVTKFQKDNGLGVDGVIGPSTAAKLKAKADGGSSTSYLYPDSNKIKWLITQPASTLWRGDPQDYDSATYNTYLTADTADHLKAAIDAFAAAAAGSVGAAGPRGQRGRPHTPFAGRRPQFPPFVRMM